AELIRGKSGRLYGNLVAVLTTMKGLPLAYNADMQEDKEPFFDSVDTLEAILGVLPPLLASLTFRTDRMRRAAGEHFSAATDLAAVVRESAIELTWTNPPRRVDRTPLRDLTRASVFRVDDAGGVEPKAAMLVDSAIAGYTEIATVRLDAPATTRVMGNRV